MKCLSQKITIEQKEVTIEADKVSKFDFKNIVYEIKKVINMIFMTICEFDHILIRKSIRGKNTYVMTLSKSEEKISEVALFLRKGGLHFELV